MINRMLSEFLKKREFVFLGTSDLKCNPNVAPKFFLKQTGKDIYLVDYAIARTYENIKINRKAAVSVMDTETLTGFRLFGTVEVIESGPVYDKMAVELKKKEISYSARRLAEGVRREMSHEDFELGFPEKVIVYKIRIEEITEIGPRGQIKRKKV